jgi:hypothetical protein
VDASGANRSSSRNQQLTRSAALAAECGYQHIGIKHHAHIGSSDIAGDITKKGEKGTEKSIFVQPGASPTKVCRSTIYQSRIVGHDRRRMSWTASAPGSQRQVAALPGPQKA